MAFFHHDYHRRFSFSSNLSISSLRTSVITHSYPCHHWQFNPNPSYFHHLACGREVAVHEGASQNDNAKLTSICHWLIVPRGRLARRILHQMLRCINALPQNRPISGDSKHILPLNGDATALARPRMFEWSPIGLWRWGSCLLNVYAAT